MFFLFANSKMIFAIIYCILSCIYHVPGMICRVLSEPCVYISLHYIEMYRAPYGADDFGTGAPDSRGAISKHRFDAPAL